MNVNIILNLQHSCWNLQGGINNMIINIYYPWYLKNNKDKVAEVCSHVSSALLMKLSEGGCDTIYYDPSNTVISVNSVSSHKFKQLIDEIENKDYPSMFYIHTEDNKGIALGFIECYT